MKKRYKKGQFTPYPCLDGCNHHLRLQDDLTGLQGSAVVKLECPNCQVEKEITVGEIKKIINSQYILG